MVRNPWTPSIGEGENPEPKGVIPMIEPALAASSAPDFRVPPRVRGKRPRAVPQVRRTPPVRKDPQPPTRKPARSERTRETPRGHHAASSAERSNEHQDRMLSNLIRELEANDRDPKDAPEEVGGSLDLMA